MNCGSGTTTTVPWEPYIMAGPPPWTLEDTLAISEMDSHHELLMGQLVTVSDWQKLRPYSCNIVS